MTSRNTRKLSRLFPPFALVWLLLGLLAAAVVARASPIVLYDKASAYNHIYVTQEAEGLRTLRFERYGARQSVVKLDDPDYLELPYLRTALLGLALSPQPRRMLVVGLGGGSLPRYLHRHYPDATIDVVDIDPDVVQVAKDYFGFREDERLRVHVADGRRYIEQASAPYDIVFLDAFGARSVPEHMTTLEFLGAVKRAVSADGVVVGNIWSGPFNKLYEPMARTYLEAFEAVTIVPVGDTGNRIVLALPRRQPIDQATLAARAKKAAATGHITFDLSATVEEQQAAEREAVRNARVLRD